MAEEQEKNEGAAGAGKKKLFIIIGAAAAVVIIAVVAFFMMSGKKETSKEASKEGAHGEVKKEEKKTESGGHGGAPAEAGKAGGGASNIHPLDPFIVNIYDGQELRYLKVKIEFELAMPEAKAELEAKQAQLKDAILILLTTKTLHDIQDLNGKNQLREEILSAANKIIPPGKIAKVYFTDFVVQ